VPGAIPYKVVITQVSPNYPANGVLQKGMRVLKCASEASSRRGWLPSWPPSWGMTCIRGYRRSIGLKGLNPSRRRLF
jgi:hypothetical protein